MVEIDIRNKGFTKKPLLADCINTMQEALSFAPVETIDLRNISSITGLILAEDVIAQVDVPQFRRSMMDGYAMAFEDIKNASDDDPIILPVKASINIGQQSVRLDPKTALKIPTGGMVPDNADIVIKIEDLEVIDDSTVKITHLQEIGKNISPAGDDFKKGEVVLSKGTRLGFSDIGVILSTGVSTITCYKRPTIAIFPTGDEIVDTATSLRPGQVYDSTTFIINELCNQLGFVLKRFPLVKDKKDLIKERITELVPNFDIILMTGGTSVGTKDFIPIIINEIGKLHVHGASVRPGSPVTSGLVEEKLIIGLPGFPVSTVSSFLFFVLPLIYYTLGGYQLKYPTIKAKFVGEIKSKQGRRDFMRVSLIQNDKGEVIAKPIMIAGSSLLRTLNKANGITILEEHEEYLKMNQIIDVIPFTWLGKF